MLFFETPFITSLSWGLKEKGAKWIEHIYVLEDEIAFNI
jgi:hypothetical protein